MSAFKAVLFATKTIRRLLGSQGVTRYIQTPNFRRLRSSQNDTKSTEMVHFWRKRLTLGVPNNLWMILVVERAALNAEMTAAVSSRSPVVSSLLAGVVLSACWKFTKVLFELIKRLLL